MTWSGDRIDLDGLRPGWGSIWQGGMLDDEGLKAVEAATEKGLVIVAMNVEARAWDYERLVDHRAKVLAYVYVGIEDSPEGCLPDDQLIVLVGTLLTVLRRGYHVVDLCAAGISRSGLLDTCLHMAALDVDWDTALTAVRIHRPQTNPNTGFVEQGKRLEAQVRALGRAA